MAGYGADEAFEAWLEANGYELPSDAPDLAVLRQRGSAYVDGAYGLRFPGAPAGGHAQERAWPRTGAETLYGETIPADAIPSQVVEASYHAALYEAENPGGLLAVTTGAPVKRLREKVGQLETETEYFSGASGAVAAATPALSAVEGLLAALLVPADLPQVLVV